MRNKELDVAGAKVPPGTLFEKDGKRREFVRLIPANRLTSAAVEWRRPGQVCRSYSCSEHAWSKWLRGACEVNQQEPMEEPSLFEHVQVSADGSTVWVHSQDGSTVGRFSKRFGLDVHTTVSQQMAGATQCLHCTHTPPRLDDWQKFCELIQQHHGIEVSPSLIRI